jgi:predicted RNase H-like HicB family nuclease
MDQRFTLLIRDEGDGMLWAEVEGLPGCFASGADLDELFEAAAEAIRMYLANDDLTVVMEGAPARPKRGAKGSGKVVPMPGLAGGASLNYAVEKAEILLEA